MARPQLWLPPLLLAAALYLAFRPEEVVINALLLPRLAWVREAREILSSAVSLPAVVIYCLPGGLWVLSATLVASSAVVSVRQRELSCAPLPLGFVLLLELLQTLGVTDGTPDPMDAIVAVLAAGLAMVMLRFVPGANPVSRPVESRSRLALPLLVLLLVAIVLSDVLPGG